MANKKSRDPNDKRKSFDTVKDFDAFVQGGLDSGASKAEIKESLKAYDLGNLISTGPQNSLFAGGVKSQFTDADRIKRDDYYAAQRKATKATMDFAESTNKAAKASAFYETSAMKLYTVAQGLHVIAGWQQQSVATAVGERWKGGSVAQDIGLQWATRPGKIGGALAAFPVVGAFEKDLQDKDKQLYGVEQRQSNANQWLNTQVQGLSGNMQSAVNLGSRRIMSPMGVPQAAKELQAKDWEANAQYLIPNVAKNIELNRAKEVQTKLQKEWDDIHAGKGEGGYDKLASLSGKMQAATEEREAAEKWLGTVGEANVRQHKSAAKLNAIEYRNQILMETYGRTSMGETTNAYGTARSVVAPQTLNAKEAREFPGSMPSDPNGELILATKELTEVMRKARLPMGD
jgi:hypothetical protein